VAEIVDSQIDVVGRQFLGLTLACARCHDHKFDPISADDYYGLAGIFFSSKISPGKLIADGRLSEEVITLPLLSKADEAKNRQLDEQIKNLTTNLHAVPGAEKLEKLVAELAALEKDFAAAKAGPAKTKLGEQAAAKKTEAEQATADLKKADAASFAKIENLRSQLADLHKQKIVPAQAMTIQEGGVPGSNREKIADAPVLIRGDFRREGNIVPRRFPVILAGEGQTRITKGSGRLELARWIATPDHPLTSRVMANRVWQHLFGDGLVRSSGNFGKLGEKPTHPELLDHLATRLVEQGWSVKKLIREIMLTKAYQQSSFGSVETVKADPANLLVGRMGRKRLTYESIRDSMLFVSGQLILTEAPPAGSPVRAMFEPLERNKNNDMMAMFDGPDPKSIIPERSDTTTAPQALFMMNNKLVIAAADKIDKSLASNTALKTDEARLDYVYRRLLGRPPSNQEKQLAHVYVKNASWGNFLQVLLCTNEFMYVD
jgi:hypothetical protein